MIAASVAASTPANGSSIKYKIAFLRQRPREKHPLLLTAGKISDLPVGEGKHLYLFKAFARDFPVLLRRALRQPKPAIASHQHHIHHVDGKIPIHRFALRNIPYAVTALPKGPAENLHPAAGKRQQSHDGLDEGGLARPIRTDDAHEASPRHREIDTVEHGPLMIGYR